MRVSKLDGLKDLWKDGHGQMHSTWMCRCLCMYLFVHICIGVYMYINTCTRDVYRDICIYIYIYLHSCTRVYRFTCMCVSM